MQIKESYVFNPDFITSIRNVVHKGNEADMEWSYRELEMKDGSTHRFIVTNDNVWHEMVTLDDALAFVLDNLWIASRFYDEGWLTTEKRLAERQAANEA